MFYKVIISFALCASFSCTGGGYQDIREVKDKIVEVHKKWKSVSYAYCVRSTESVFSKESFMAEWAMVKKPSFPKHDIVKYIEHHTDVLGSDHDYLQSNFRYSVTENRRLVISDFFFNGRVYSEVPDYYIGCELVHGQPRFILQRLLRELDDSVDKQLSINTVTDFLREENMTGNLALWILEKRHQACGGSIQYNTEKLVLDKSCCIIHECSSTLCDRSNGPRKHFLYKGAFAHFLLNMNVFASTPDAFSLQLDDQSIMKFCPLDKV